MAKLNLTPALTWDDVVLVPQHSDVKSRSRVNISSCLDSEGYLQLDVPIISANMNSITESQMAIAMGETGGLGILHRYADVYQIKKWICAIKTKGCIAIPSVGIGKEDLDRALSYLDCGANGICVDIAYANNRYALEFIEKLAGIILGYKRTCLIAGNVCTFDGAQNLVQAGCNIIKVGVGNGSNCTTRVVTGHGIPQLTALMEVDRYAQESKHAFKVISDGGCKNSGDICKALVYADAIMTGNLLAGTDETPGEVVNGNKTYAGMACYSQDTEVLTDEGWKQFSLITKNDLLATLNQGTGFLEYQIPTDIFNYSYSGDMVRVKSGVVDLLVTPNHRMFVAKKTSVSRGYLPKFKFVLAEDCINGAWKFKATACWSGYDEETMIIGDRTIKMKDWVDFFGFWIAEGYARKGSLKNQKHHKNKPHFNYTVSISNNNKKIIDHYKKMLTKWGLTPSIRLRGKNYELTVCDKSICEYLIQFGYSFEKYIPSDIKGLSTELLLVLLNSIYLGDGTKSKKIITTSSTRLRDDLHEIALKCGKTPHYVRDHKKGSSGSIGGKSFIRNHDTWSVYIGDNSKTPFIRSSGFTKEKYDGQVWCVKVPNGIVYVRRNGKSIWCGNSEYAQMGFRGAVNNSAPEGIHRSVEAKGPVAGVIEQLAGGVRSGLSYSGAHNLFEFKQKAELRVVTSNGHREGLPHGLFKEY